MDLRHLTRSVERKTFFRWCVGIMKAWNNSRMIVPYIKTISTSKNDWYLETTPYYLITFCMVIILDVSYLRCIRTMILAPCFCHCFRTVRALSIYEDSSWLISMTKSVTTFVLFRVSLYLPIPCLKNYLYLALILGLYLHIFSRLSSMGKEFKLLKHCIRCCDQSFDL